MPRIAGVDIPNDKRVLVSLTYIFGIGPATSAKILTETNVKPSVRYLARIRNAEHAEEHHDG